MGKLLYKIDANNRCYFRNTLGILELFVEKLSKHQFSEICHQCWKILKGSSLSKWAKYIWVCSATSFIGNSWIPFSIILNFRLFRKLFYHLCRKFLVIIKFCLILLHFDNFLKVKRPFKKISLISILFPHFEGVIIPTNCTSYRCNFFNTRLSHLNK